MMRRIVIIQGHPDPHGGRKGHELDTRAQLSGL